MRITAEFFSSRLLMKAFMANRKVSLDDLVKNLMSIFGEVLVDEVDLWLDINILDLDTVRSYVLNSLFAKVFISDSYFSLNEMVTLLTSVE